MGDNPEKAPQFDLTELDSFRSTPVGPDISPTNAPAPVQTSESNIKDAPAQGGFDAGEELLSAIHEQNTIMREILNLLRSTLAE